MAPAVYWLARGKKPGSVPPRGLGAWDDVGADGIRFSAAMQLRNKLVRHCNHWPLRVLTCWFELVMQPCGIPSTLRSYAILLEQPLPLHMP
jgi:hypothetical protein